MRDLRRTSSASRRISTDPEWKYVNVRRYLAYLEQSIDRGTQWAVFEPNGEALWANVRRTVEDFLLAEWQARALVGDRPERAYFVKCDRSTMSQNDLDNGRLICLIGVAPVRPAEFVLLRIGQWTADHTERGTSTATARDEPYRNFNFLVDFCDGPMAAFQEVSGLGMEKTISSVRLGRSKQSSARKIPGTQKSTDVTMKRGVIGSTNLYTWLDRIGRKNHRPVRQVTIRRQNPKRTAVLQTWKLTNVRIVKYASDPFNAKGTDVAMDELVLVYERLELEPTECRSARNRGKGDMADAVVIYGIKNCDTMKKARAWLEARDIPYAFHDYKTQGVERRRLDTWAGKVGWEKLLNRAGTTFRKLPDKDKQALTEKKAITLMLDQPSIIRRPVIEIGGRLLVGFDAPEYEQAFASFTAKASP